MMFKEGDYVIHLKSTTGVNMVPTLGRIKYCISDPKGDIKYFIVYNCNDDWDNYFNYGAVMTSADSLIKVKGVKEGAVINKMVYHEKDGVYWVEDDTTDIFILRNFYY